MTELRRRMTADLQLAGYSQKTQHSYLMAVRGLAKHYMRPPDQLRTSIAMIAINTKS